MAVRTLWSGKSRNLDDAKRFGRGGVTAPMLEGTYFSYGKAAKAFGLASGHATLVASIEHTGTRFLTDHLLAGVPGVYSHHLTNDAVFVLREKMREYPCIVPMRHPAKVAQSWSNQGRELDELWNSYRRLILSIDPLGPLYLPLDVSDRQQYLDAINDRCGLALRTDWPVIGSSGITIGLQGPGRTIVRDMVEELSDFFGRFGYTDSSTFLPRRVIVPQWQPF